MIRDEDEISKVGYRGNHDVSKETSGIKFMDRRGKEIAKWDAVAYSWRYIDVEPDENLIGIVGCIMNSGSESYIESLRFKTLSLSC